MIVRTDLPHALEHFDIDALFGEAGEKTSDGMRRPSHGFGHLRSAGPALTPEHGDDLSLLGIFRGAAIFPRGGRGSQGSSKRGKSARHRIRDALVATVARFPSGQNGQCGLMQAVSRSRLFPHPTSPLRCLNRYRRVGG